MDGHLLGHVSRDGYSHDLDVSSLSISDLIP